MKMTHALWMKDTAAFGRMRSAELKQVDNAFLAYERALQHSDGSVLNERRSLQQSLKNWQNAQLRKGQKWQSSVRNKLKAAEVLDAELGHVIVGAGGLSSRGELMVDPAELRAAKIVADDIRRNTRQMFTGQKLTTKESNSRDVVDLNDIRKELTTWEGHASGIKDAAKGVVEPGLAQRLQTTLVDLFGDAGAAQAQRALGPLFYDVLTKVTPFMGAFTSGYKALDTWGQAAKGLYSEHKLSRAGASFAPGDPAAAFEAILLIQQREVKICASTASIHTVSAGAKAAFTAADLGAVSGALLGAAESLALLMQKIYLFARDWNEINDANELLLKGDCDLNLFRTCPLLGCYLVANSDTSHVIDLAVGDYGRPGWKFEVEAMVRKAQPVFEKARSVIDGSRYEIAGMRGMKGTVGNSKVASRAKTARALAQLVRAVASRIDKIRS